MKTPDEISRTQRRDGKNHDKDEETIMMTTIWLSVSAADSAWHFLTASMQIRLFDAFLSRTQLIEVYYRWRPNLPDEGDNHVLELAVAAGDAPIVSYNRRDFRGGELRFPSIVVQSPAAWLKSQRL